MAFSIALVLILMPVASMLRTKLLDIELLDVATSSDDTAFRSVDSRYAVELSCSPSTVVDP